MRRSAPGALGVDARPAAGTVSHALPADLGAVREARGVVRDVLQGWSAEDLFDDVELVASELVANALRHGLQVEAEPDPQARTEAVLLSLVSTGTHVICAVTDPSSTPPVRRVADPMAGSGRGLQLVESLSLCWGWTVLDGDDCEAGEAHGKSVWAIFPFGADDHQVVGAA